MNAPDRRPGDYTLTPAAAADRAGVSEETVRRWIRSGRLAAYAWGPRSIRVHPDDLDALFKAVTQ